MRHQNMIKVTINTDLIDLTGGIYKPIVELIVFEEGVRMMVEPIAILRGDELSYEDALKQIPALVKRITVAYQDEMSKRIDEILAENTPKN